MFADMRHTGEWKAGRDNSVLKNNDDYENNVSSFRIIVELAALEGFS